MAEVRMHANRNLRPRVLSSGERRGIPNYVAFNDGQRPSWWAEFRYHHDGELLGVIENTTGSGREAIVVTSEEMLVLEEPVVRRLRYDDIASVGRLDKDPVSETIRVARKSGGTFELPVRGQTGAIGDVQRYLLCVAREF